MANGKREAPWKKKVFIRAKPPRKCRDKEQLSMKLIKKLIFIYSFLIILFLAGCQSPNESKEVEYTYQVSKPLVKDVRLNDEYVCQIRAIQHIELRSLEKGYLQKKYVDEGQFVRQGQLLFQIKPNIYKADVQKSQAEVDLAQIELKNNKALVEKDIISKSESAMSAAKLAKAEAELEMSKTHLGFTEIRAPFNGLVGRLGNIRTGSLLDEGELLTTLSDNHKMWVYFNVPEAQYLNYMKKKRNNISQTVQLKLANKEVYSEAGTIETIESDFSNTSGNIAFRATFNNPHLLLRYGQTGNILWSKLIKKAIIIPQKSTFEILDKKFVLVVDKKGVLHEREIVVAEEAPNIFILKSGIRADEMFLLERQNNIYKGDKIKYKIMDPQSVIKSLDLYAN
ncbi:MAG: efflux transporter periplasmic adaptor subunit [Gammaproteobacteria bacterium]|nr:efflux transporter periplasmic adaptor subunit [Gammaproteobacteria bacterium]